MSAVWSANEKLLFLALMDLHHDIIGALDAPIAAAEARVFHILEAYTRDKMAEEFGHLSMASALAKSTAQLAELKAKNDVELQAAIEAESKRFADNVNALIAARK